MDPGPIELNSSLLGLVLHIRGIKLQLLFGVRIELAVGSFSYPGNYLDFQFVSPGRGRPLSGFPICKPCLEVPKIPLGIPTFLPMEGLHSQNLKPKE